MPIKRREWFFGVCYTALKNVDKTEFLADRAIELGRSRASLISEKQRNT
jgi:hypothetical protein